MAIAFRLYQCGVERRAPHTSVLLLTGPEQPDCKYMGGANAPRLPGIFLLLSPPCNRLPQL